MADCKNCRYGASGGGGNFGYVSIVCCYYGSLECDPAGDCQNFEAVEQCLQPTNGGLCENPDTITLADGACSQCGLPKTAIACAGQLAGAGNEDDESTPSAPFCAIARECYFGQDNKCLRGGICR